MNNTKFSSFINLCKNKWFVFMLAIMICFTSLYTARPVSAVETDNQQTDSSSEDSDNQLPFTGEDETITSPDSDENNSENFGDDTDNSGDSDDASEKESINVLFIGNSNTFTNNVPMMVKGLCDASKINVNIYSVTAGGYKLSQFASADNMYNPIIMSTLAEVSFDYVVLQDHRDSIVPNPEKTLSAIETLLPAIELSGAKIVIYAQQCDFVDRTYKINNCSVSLSRDEAQLLMARNYSYVANSFNAPIAHSGINFSRCMNIFPDIVLYNTKDNIHPSVAGSYMAACTLYKTLFAQSSFGNDYLPGSAYDTSSLIEALDYDNALKIQKIADADLKLSQQVITINKGDNAFLSGSVNYSEENDLMNNYTNTIHYQSMDTSIATVNKSTGRISAFATGTTSIMATTDSGLMNFCTLNILQPATSIKLSTTQKITLGYKEKYQLSATTKPSDCTDSITWSTSNPSVATVNSEGLVTAKKAGKTKITVTADSGVSQSVNVYVKLIRPKKLKATVTRYRNWKNRATITLSWTANSNAKKYSVFRSTSKNSGYKRIAIVNSANYVDKNLPKDTVYYYKIRAIHSNTTCNSELSYPIKVTTKLPAIKKTSTKTNTTTKSK